MKKTIQTILLTLVISIGIAARISILGWLFAIGIGSALIFGISHIIIHFYSMNYLSLNGKKNILKIVLSHLFFLCIFLFQFDFDDSRSYTVLGHLFGIESTFLNDVGFSLVGISVVAYIIVSIVIVIGAKKEKIRGNNTKYLIPTIIISLILPFIIVSGLYTNKELQKTKETEKTGEYNSISRALKNPENVTEIRINSYQDKIFKFPSEIFDLPNLREIDFNGQNISTIPDDIVNAKNLEILNLIDNEIQEIPASICQCDNLKELRIGGDIEFLPECLKTMRSLKHLSIQSNSVNELMDELREFEYLETSHFYLKDGILDKEKLTRIRKETGIEHKY